MNFVFISPHFPHTYWNFCQRLKQNGVTVLGIADAPYESLPHELKESLTEYYRVESLENYDEVYRAVAYLVFRYGRIDWIESNNEYWLAQDARLRTDFNVTTGIQTDRIRAIKEKSEMKKYYAEGQVPTARQISADKGEEAVRLFAAKAGYPIIAKPDVGVGASGTYKIHDDKELKHFYETELNYDRYVVEEFITGEICSYDAVISREGEPIFESMTVWPPSIMDIVNKKLDLSYYVDREMPEPLRELGRRTVKAFGVWNRFVHLEFFRLDSDREGLGKQGDFVALEVNMRPAGGYTPDMINYAHSTDVYKIWADMVAFGKSRTAIGDHHHRIELHERWYHYIVDELIPEVRHFSNETFIVTGCSMGGYHAGNFFFRRPDLFDTLLALSGLYYAGYFFPDYQDALIYDNSPQDFLRQMPANHPYWDIYRQRRIVMCVGQGAWEDELLDSTRQMDALLQEKNVPAWIDYWGFDSAHDWAWWRKQLVYFIDKLLAPDMDYVI